MSGKLTATVGTFDGVHAGHRKVLEMLVKQADAHGYKPMVFTFDRHPLQTIAPERAPKRIMPVDEEVALLRNCGVGVRTLAFDEDMMRLSARQWFARMRYNYGVSQLVMGYDNTFGHDGRNLNMEDYVRLGKEAGIEVSVAPVVPGVSSSAVRKAIIAGDIEKANHALGREWKLSGMVVHGDALGRTIGFPTANLKVSGELVRPASGVYAAMAEIPGESERKLAVVNIGTRPTVQGTECRIEAHLPEYSGDLYDKELSLFFLGRIRDERKFDGLNELGDAIRSDIGRAKEICHIGIF